MLKEPPLLWAERGAIGILWATQRPAFVLRQNYEVGLIRLLS